MKPRKIVLTSLLFLIVLFSSAFAQEDRVKCAIPSEEPPEIIGGWSALYNNMYLPASFSGTDSVMRVTVIADLDEKGKVISTEIFTGKNDTLNTIARQAVAKLRFTPFRNEGRPEKTTVHIPVKFGNEVTYGDTAVFTLPVKEYTE